VAGDLNDRPGAPVLAAAERAGWRDAWPVAHRAEEGPTNWSSGRRTGRLPDQRLDYVLVPAGVEVFGVEVPTGAEALALAEVSDHLPVTARLRAGHD
jgi:endonuclease/exonuclease/phosphatase family metal-dependent hydrolase